MKILTSDITLSLLKNYKVYTEVSSILVAGIDTTSTILTYVF